jgi:phosphatidate cytidylyltransferase
MGVGSGDSGRVLADNPASGGDSGADSGADSTGNPLGDPQLAGKKSRWSDLTLRVASALVLLPLAIICVWLGGYAYSLLIALGCLVMAYEWLGMCGASASDKAWFWFPIGLVAVSVSAGFGSPATSLIAVAIGTLVAWAFPLRRASDAAVHERTPAKPPPSGTARLAEGTTGNARPAACIWDNKFNLAFGVPYIGLAAVAMSELRADPEAGLGNTLFVLSIVWGSDIGAYLVGRLVGGPRLAPTISPGKTWSGAVGGLVSAALAGTLVAACLSSGFSSSRVIGLAIVLGIVSQAGDLLESALKRHFGVKDSGRIIPGHGGLLDRIDALLAVAPAAALLALSVGRGVVLWR